ncbi:MAG: hypothetical protein F6J93_10075 [Oscillatoria sp. SIO1A7]|nr:hypothetical protein [Oscillatoria sp. SIO1A7]
MAILNHLRYLRNPVSSKNRVSASRRYRILDSRHISKEEAEIMEKYILKRLQSIQKELAELTDLMAREMEGKPPRPTKLKGMWAGKFEVTDEEIEEAKRDLFRDKQLAE